MNIFYSKVFSAFSYSKHDTNSTATHEIVADRKRLDVNQAVSIANINAAIPHNGFSVIENIAGTVITDNVT